MTDLHLPRRASCTLLLLGLCNCVNAPAEDWCAPWGRRDPIDATCHQYRAVEKYLENLQREIAPHFELPRDYNEDGYVEIRFALAEDGSLADRCIARSTDNKLARRALAALDGAAPFPPMSRFARCIAGAEIVRHVDTVRHD